MSKYDWEMTVPLKQEDLLLHMWYYLDYPYLKRDKKFKYMGHRTFISIHPNFQEVTFRVEEFPIKAVLYEQQDRTH